MAPAIPAPGMTAPRQIAVREAWLDRVREEILEPALPIVDPHHHLWDRPGERYLLDDLLRDTGSGHDIRATVFVQCGAMYRAAGPRNCARSAKRSSPPARRRRARAAFTARRSPAPASSAWWT